jgi:hypothetical protein
MSLIHKFASLLSSYVEGKNDFPFDMYSLEFIAHVKS